MRFWGLRLRPYQKALAVLVFCELGLRLAGYIYVQDKWSRIERRHYTPGLRILALGESTTYGLWVERKDSYPKQLERMLQQAYPSLNITVNMPPLIGQNTSQILNRMDYYLDHLKPSIVIIMCGANNGWSLAENNVANFLPLASWRGIRYRAYRVLDQIRLVKLVRLTVGRMNAGFHKWFDTVLGLSPEGNEYKDVPDFARVLEDEPVLLEAWRSDMDGLLEKTRSHGARAVLMTYPLYPFPPPAAVEELGARWNVPVVLNHVDFQNIVECGLKDDYIIAVGHPNAAGYAIVANNAFHVLQSCRVIQ